MARIAKKRKSTEPDSFPARFKQGLEDSSLPEGARHLARYMSDHAHNPVFPRAIWHSIDSMAKATGMSPSTVKRHKRTLEQCGVIVSTRRNDEYGHRTSDRVELQEPFEGKACPSCGREWAWRSRPGDCPKCQNDL